MMPLFPMSSEEKTGKGSRMVHRTIQATILGIAWTLTLPVLVAAQQPAAEGKQPPQSRQHSEMQSMDDMMQQCQSHYQEMTASMDRMMKRMEEAMQSNDPGRCGLLLSRRSSRSWR